MRLIKVFERKGDEYNEYKRALKMAKESIEILCDLTDEMDERYSERDDYRPRYRNEEYSRMEERSGQTNWRYR